MFVGNFAKLCRKMSVSVEKAIHSEASSQTFPITSNSAEKLLAVATGIVGLGMLGYEIKSVMDIKNDMRDFKNEVTKNTSELKVDVKNIEFRLQTQQDRTDALIKTQQERTDNLYKVLMEEQKQNSDRFYSLLKEIKKKKG